VGWMSRYGERLDLPVRLPDGEVLESVCSATGEIYRLVGDQLECVEADRDVTAAIP
jgi:UDP-2-acetamido-3-amino-2,3-dideoxy-glucuronate N-acetyltransferase